LHHQALQKNIIIPAVVLLVIWLIKSYRPDSAVISDGCGRNSRSVDSLRTRFLASLTHNPRPDASSLLAPLPHASQEISPQCLMPKPRSIASYPFSEELKLTSTGLKHEAELDANLGSRPAARENLQRLTIEQLAERLCIRCEPD
jgi:hypothetical protein